VSSGEATPAPTDEREPVLVSGPRAFGEAATAMLDPGAAQSVVDPWIGRVLDQRYRITERLGEGGMGAVFVAEHLKLPKAVAIKVIRAELAGNGEVAARFVREAMATAQFEHPHVASAIDFGTLEEGGAFLVMQLVRGKSLRDLLDQQGKLPWQTACELLAQVADALSAARLAGIVHRDLKPENILVETREDGTSLAKILDFGIAHVMPQLSHESAQNARVLTRVGTVMGTPGYMSPEQAVGDRVDHRTDLYALGVVLWESVTGKPLWDGPDVTSIITRQLSEQVPRTRELLANPNIPRALDDLLQRLCARSAEDRPEHAGQVRDELRALARITVTPATELVDRARELLSVARLRFARLPPASRALLLATAASLVFALLAIAFGRQIQPRAAAPTRPPTAATSASGDEANDTTAPSEPEAEPTFTERALKLAERVVSPVERAVAPRRIPKELEEDATTLVDSERSSERRRAATKIMHWKPEAEVPAYLQALARLETARRCSDKKAALAELMQLKDRRCLNALRRMADTGRSGCGFLGFSDCYGCVRPDLRKAVDSFDGKD
jgi:hypothetical protein